MSWDWSDPLGIINDTIVDFVGLPLGVASSFVNLFDGVFDFFSSIDPIESLGTGIAAGLAIFAAAFKEAYSSLAAILGSALNSCFQLIKLAWDRFSDLLYTAIEYLGYALNLAIGFIGSALYSLGEWVFDAMAELAAVVVGIIENFLNWVAGVAQKMLDFVASAVGEVADVAEAHLTQFARGIVSKLERMLMVNIVMGVINSDVEKGTFEFKKTGMKAIGALVFGSIAGSVLRTVTE